MTAAGLAAIPLIELPATPGGDALAIVLSGDGGWRDIDKSLAEELRKQGVSVVGWDSLRYFWTRRSPEQLADDLGRVIRAYAGKLACQPGRAGRLFLRRRRAPLRL